MQVRPCKLAVRHPCLSTVLSGHPRNHALFIFFSGVESYRASTGAIEKDHQPNFRKDNERGPVDWRNVCGNKADRSEA